LADNDLIIQSTAANKASLYSTIFGYLFTGRAGGAWNGRRINSSAAAADSNRNTVLGAIINDSGDGITPIRTTLAGEPVDVNTILVKYTYNGDANLDGIDNADDYALLDAGFASHATGYYNGDFNYTGGPPNSDDYFLIDKAFSGQSGPLGAPEPAPQPAEASAVASTVGSASADPAPIAAADATIASATSDSETTKKSRRHRHHRSGARELPAEQKSPDRWLMPGTF